MAEHGYSWTVAMPRPNPLIYGAIERSIAQADFAEEMHREVE
jgi:hypothetical protein